MTPSEAARAVVEAWARRTHRQGHAGASCQHCLDELARDLTPVYERAQALQQDSDRDAATLNAQANQIRALRERAEAAEAKLAKIEELATPFVRDGKWVRIDDHPPTWYEVSVEVAEACLKLSRRVAQAEEQLRETLITAGRERERAERAEAERDKARETCNRLNKRCQSYEAGLAEKIKDARDRSGWGLGRMLANAAAEQATAQRDAAEADVKRLREALAALGRMPSWDDQQTIIREALAATERK